MVQGFLGIQRYKHLLLNLRGFQLSILFWRELKLYLYLWMLQAAKINLFLFTVLVLLYSNFPVYFIENKMIVLIHYQSLPVRSNVTMLICEKASHKFTI